MFKVCSISTVEGGGVECVRYIVTVEGGGVKFDGDCFTVDCFCSIVTVEGGGVIDDECFVKVVKIGDDNVDKVVKIVDDNVDNIGEGWASVNGGSVTIVDNFVDGLVEDGWSDTVELEVNVVILSSVIINK